MKPRFGALRSSIGILAGVTVLAAWTGDARAQLEDNISNFVEGNAEGYLKPLQEAFGQALNSNFFTSAQIPSHGFHVGFDLKFMGVFFDTDDETFQAITGEGFSPEQTVEAPTAVGSTEGEVVFGDGGTSYAFPGGFDLGAIAIGVPQLTLSGFGGTEATLRWIAVDTGDAEIGNISLFGVGIRHNISQYLVAPPVEVAAAIYYQTFNLGSDDLIDSSAFSIGLQGSRSLGIISAYGGVSYDTMTMDVNYTFTGGAEDEDINLSMESEKTLHLSAGVVFNLGPVHLNVNGDLAQRTGLSVGLGAQF